MAVNNDQKKTNRNFLFTVYKNKNKFYKSKNIEFNKILLIQCLLLPLRRAWNRIHEYQIESGFFRIRIRFLKNPIISLSDLKQISEFEFEFDNIRIEFR